MPAAATSGPVTRRQSKRKSNAVTEEAQESAESVAKRVKTEATTQEQQQGAEGHGEANEPEKLDADDSSSSDSSQDDSDDSSSSSSEEEAEMLPSRPAHTGELLNEYLMIRMQEIAGISDQFTQDFVNETQARFGWMNTDDIVNWPEGGAPVILPEWSRRYALDLGVPGFKTHNNWKVRTSKDAQHAVRVIERCKQSKDRVTSDEEFIRRWQRRWQKDVLAQTELMFNHILRPYESYKRTLETTGRILSDEITGYARRQTRRECWRNW